METMVYSALTVAVLVIWYCLEKTIMTPYDIYRKWEADILYIAPEDLPLMMVKTSRAITACENIFDAHGPRSEAGEEAVQVLQKLRQFHTELVLRSKNS